MICNRCLKETGNEHQGHHWGFCQLTGSLRRFHFCCPGNCELGPLPPNDDLPLDESADASVLAQAKQDHAEAQAERQPEEPVSLLRIAEIRHKARAEAIKQGRLAEVLRSDAALEGSVSDAEDIVQATLLKAGVDEPIADLTRMGISLLGRMFLGMGPSPRDFIETTRKLYGDERTPERKVPQKMAP